MTDSAGVSLAEGLTRSRRTYPMITSVSFRHLGNRCGMILDPHFYWVCRADASERLGVFGIPDARFTPLPATVGRSPRTALLPTTGRGRDARKWDRRLSAQTGGPFSPKSSSSGATRSATGFLRAEGAGVAARAGQGKDFYEADITNSGAFKNAVSWLPEPTHKG
jgi:hypothetical protein